MMCGKAKELMASAWVGEVDPQLRAHLSGCPECAAEMAQLSVLWERLGAVSYTHLTLPTNREV